MHYHSIMDTVTDADLIERERDVIAAFCGKRPELDLMAPNQSLYLQDWICDNLLPQFSYSTAIDIMDAAENISQSQILNGLEGQEGDEP